MRGCRLLVFFVLVRFLREREERFWGLGFFWGLGGGGGVCRLWASRNLRVPF